MRLEALLPTQSTKPLFKASLNWSCDVALIVSVILQVYSQLILCWAPHLCVSTGLLLCSSWLLWTVHLCSRSAGHCGADHWGMKGFILYAAFSLPLQWCEYEFHKWGILHLAEDIRLNMYKCYLCAVLVARSPSSGETWCYRNIELATFMQFFLQLVISMSLYGIHIFSQFLATQHIFHTHNALMHPKDIIHISG